MANTPDKSNKTPLSDDERDDLMAMIAAGRELSPEMDKSLVESYAERRASQQQARDKLHGNTAVTAQPQQQSGTVVANQQHPAVTIAGMVTIAAIFIAVMIFTQGGGWWVIFPLFALFGGVLGNNNRHQEHAQRRAERYQMRANYYRARMGYPPEADEPRLPQPTQQTRPAPSDSGPLPPPSSVMTPPPSASAPPATGTGTQPPINPAG